MDIVQRVVAEHPRGNQVRIIVHEHNMKIGAARNTALDNASARYLYFLDSDDEMEPDTIEYMYRHMEQHPVDVLQASYAILKNGKKLQDVANSGYIYISDIAKAYMEKRITVYTWNKLFDLNFIRQHSIRFATNEWAEDVMFMSEIAVFAQSYGLLDRITYRYILNNGSISNRLRAGYTDFFYQQFLKLYQHSLKLLSIAPIDRKQYIANDIISMGYYASRALTSSNNFSKQQVLHYFRRDLDFPKELYQYKMCDFKHTIFKWIFSKPAIIRYILLFCVGKLLSLRRNIDY